MRIWAPTPGRQMLLYPWFDTVQVIQHPERATAATAGLYFSAVGVRVADTTHVYAGDSAGNLHVIDQVGGESSALLLLAQQQMKL